MSFFSNLLHQMSEWTTSSFALLAPAGSIAAQEKHLMLLALVVMCIVVIPTFALLIFVAIRYREGNTKAKFTPYWSHNVVGEFIWWGVPIIIIGVLAVILWGNTHALNPYKPLDSDVPPVTVEVVALNWKWLFIYPEQGIATVNYLEIPTDTPIAFQISADAPMNSFWIPRLSGQIYAMPGMITQLHFNATEPGTFNGLSSNFSGRGFATMNFPTVAVSPQEFALWVEKVKTSDKILNQATYQELSEPSKAVPKTYYKLADKGLFLHIVMKYMMPMYVSQVNPGAFFQGGKRTADQGRIYPGIPKVPESLKK